MPERWNQKTSDSSDVHDAVEHDGLKMIPIWSIVLAILVFVGWLYFSYYAQPHRHGPQPIRLLMAYMTGTVLASYVLLVGYVSRDVKRRNMPALLWMLIVVVMPGGIGAVVYFLLRQPLMIRCPNCNTELNASVHFCPQCRFQVAPVCGQCFRGVQITDAYCPQCGHDISEDGGPSRLRAYSDS
ncbi:MAG: double zinc ribbon domain-containing protein [Acidobacteriaceae bacterium]